MTSRHWLRTPSDEDPEPYSEDECRYCEEVRRENAQVVEINAALHDALHDLCKAAQNFIDGEITYGQLEDVIEEGHLLLGEKDIAGKP